MPKGIKHRKKRYVISDLFQKYPYRTYRTSTKRKPGANKREYVKKIDRVDDHIYSTEYYLYREIIFSYLEERENDYINGLPTYLPHRMGMLQLFKYKPVKTVNTHLPTGKKYANIHSGRFKPFSVWHRTKAHGGFNDGFLRLWDMIPTKALWTKISYNLRTDSAYIHKLQLLGTKQ